MNSYYDSRELDIISNDMSDALFKAEDRLKQIGVPNPHLAAMKLTMIAALATLPELPYTFGAKLSEVREIKEYIDNMHDVLKRKADEELEASKHTNVMYVNFNKGREI